MSSGKAHRRAALILAPIAAIGAGCLSRSLLAAFWTGTGCLASISLNPDLDQEGISASEWRLVQRIGPLGHLWMAYWWFYARIIPHRSPWSHLPGFGTLLRLLYTIPLIIGAVALASRVARHFDANAFTVSDVIWSAAFWQVMVYVYAGLCISDAAHMVMDVL